MQLWAQSSSIRSSYGIKLGIALIAVVALVVEFGSLVQAETELQAAD